jgi:hypothetical protein
MVINSHLFEAYLKCTTKFYLKAIGEAGAGNVYAEWLNVQNKAHRFVFWSFTWRGGEG